MSKDISIKKNTQDKLHDYLNSALSDNQNQNHNAKNDGLGPNTKRKG